MSTTLAEQKGRHARKTKIDIQRCDRCDKPLGGTPVTRVGTKHSGLSVQLAFCGEECLRIYRAAHAALKTATT